MQQADVGGVERVLPLDILQAQDAGHLIADEHRYAQPGLGRDRPGQRGLSKTRRLFRHVGAHQDRLAGLDDLRAKAPIWEAAGGVDTLTAFDGIAMLDGVGLPVIGRNHHDLRLEHIADLIADQIVDGLDLEARGECLLNAVDDGQLRLTLGEFLFQLRNIILGRSRQVRQGRTSS